MTRWKPGDRVTVHCNYVDLEGPEGHDDSMMDMRQRIWGFETNFGGMAEISMVKANQLMPMPTHLTWEEARRLSLTLATCYRMLVSPARRGDEAGRRRADLGRHGRARRVRASSWSRNGGGIPVCVVVLGGEGRPAALPGRRNS